mgnify:CR=1 FL=1
MMHWVRLRHPGKICFGMVGKDTIQICAGGLLLSRASETAGEPAGTLARLEVLPGSQA